MSSIVRTTGTESYPENEKRERLADEALGLVFHFLNSANLFLTSITFGSTRPIPNYILRQQTMKLSFILIFNDAERQLYERSKAMIREWRMQVAFKGLAFSLACQTFIA